MRRGNVRVATGTLALTAALVCALALPLLGCGAYRARRAAALLASQTETVRVESERVARSRSALAKARLAGIQALERSALETEFRNDRELFLLGLSKPGRARAALYGELLEESERTLAYQNELRSLQDQHREAVRAAGTRMRVDRANLSKTSQALAELAEPPTLMDSIGFYVDFFREVMGAVQEQEQAAAQAATNGEQQAEAKDAVR